MSEILGTPLAAFSEHIGAALEYYQDRTVWRQCEDPTVQFDIAKARILEPTPDKPNTVRSVSEVRYLGQAIGNLYVIAFAPGDGTGDENSGHNLAEIETGSYPHVAGVVPRDKTTTHTEAHLTIVSLAAESRNADPVPLAGSLQLLGIRDEELVRLADLGWPPRAHDHFHMAGRKKAIGNVTATTGYYDQAKLSRLTDDTTFPRFGGTHAVYNATHDIQVCGFLGLTPQVVAEHGIGAITDLEAHAPHLR